MLDVIILMRDRLENMDRKAIFEFMAQHEKWDNS
jgi:hypothetical protein